MNPDHAHFAEWDAAYVLGALSPSDRRAFETHLESCEHCWRALAEIAPTLGLMARVDRARAQSLLDEAREDAAAAPLQMSASGRDDLVARAVRETRRRRRTWWTAGLAAAAVFIVAVVVAVSVAVAPAVRGIRVAELASVADVPIAATVEFAPAAWGTRIQLECSYEGDGGADAPDGGRPYALVVTDRAGQTSEVSSWRAVPGATARLSAATALSMDDIAAIEIRSVTSDRVLMRTEFQ